MKVSVNGAGQDVTPGGIDFATSWTEATTRLDRSDLPVLDPDVQWLGDVAADDCAVHDSKVEHVGS
jgi:hypothetical protein